MVHKVLLILSLFSIYLFPQEYPDKKVDILLKSGIGKILNQDYEGAENTFKLLKKRYPNVPLGDIYLASTEIAKSYDFQSGYKDSLIYAYLNSARTTSEKLIEKDPKLLWNRYFIGLVEGYSAYYKALRENWIGAFTKAISAVGIFREILQDSASFYEAYAPIGTYVYWKSRKLESLNWLPFVEDETSAGIQLLETAARKSAYNRYLTFYSLIWIYIDQKQFEKAVSSAEEILKEYPSSRLFKWALARALEDTDKQRSIKTYYEILNSYSFPGIVNEITLKHKIAQQYLFLGKKGESLKLCTEILSKKIDDRYRSVLDERIERVKALYQQITD